MNDSIKLVIRSNNIKYYIYYTINFAFYVRCLYFILTSHTTPILTDNDD